MLFRHEVFQARRQRAFGHVAPLYAGQTLPIVLILLAAVAVLSIWLTTGSYARTAMVSGWVVPSGPTARIRSARRGTLVQLDVHDGERVHKGDRLGVVDIQSANDLASDPAAQSLAIVKRKRAELGTQRIIARQGNADEARRLDAEAGQLHIRITAMDRQINLQRARVASSRKSLDILSDAHKKKYISEIDYETQRRAHLDEKGRLQSLIVERAALQSQFDDNRSQRQRLPIDLKGKLADLSASDLQLDQQRLDIEGGSTIALTAPIDGRVTALQGRPGQSVSPDLPVMYVMGGSARMAVELFAPSQAIGFAHVGQHVRLMYDAFPYQQFGSFTGTIESISHAALTPDEIDAPIKLAAPAYRIRVRLGQQAVAAFGGRYPIQPGMTVKADVILERQSFLAWLLEPINAVRRRT